MIELKKIELVLKSIIDLCDHTTSGNVSHKIATIKHQATYAQEQLEIIKESENQLILNGD